MIIRSISNKKRAKQIFNSIQDVDWDIEAFNEDEIVITFWRVGGSVMYQYYTEDMGDIYEIIEKKANSASTDCVR